MSVVDFRTSMFKSGVPLNTECSVAAEKGFCLPMYALLGFMEASNHAWLDGLIHLSMLV